MNATKILSTVRIDIPVDYSFGSYQNTVNFKSSYSSSFQSYLTPVSGQFSELATVVFRATWKLKTLCFLLIFWVDNCSFRGYLRKLNRVCFWWTVWVENRSFQSLKREILSAGSLGLNFHCYFFFLRWATQNLLKTPELKPFRTSTGKLRYFYCGAFSDRETLKL